MPASGEYGTLPPLEECGVRIAEFRIPNSAFRIPEGFGISQRKVFMPIQHSVSGHALTDVLERVLDKGIVIAGDIKISLINTELLTIQIRLLIASVDRAKELGIDWWSRPGYMEQFSFEGQIEALQRRLESLESAQKEGLSTLKKQLETMEPKKKKWRL